jgi:hypothetical protein
LVLREPRCETESDEDRVSDDESDAGVSTQELAESDDGNPIRDEFETDSDVSSVKNYYFSFNENFSKV